MQCMAQHRFMGESNAGIGLHNSIYRAEKGKGGPMYELYLILDRASPEERWGLAEILDPDDWTMPQHRHHGGD